MKFETYKAHDGEVRWRLRAASGEVVTLKPGKINLLPASASKKKTSERVVSFSLKRDAGNGRLTSSKTLRGNKSKPAKA